MAEFLQVQNRSHTLSQVEVSVERFLRGRWFAVAGTWWFPAVIWCLLRRHGETFWHDGEWCERCGGPINE